MGGPRVAAEPMICDICGGDVDIVFWAESGGLCGDCLARNALPLTRIRGNYVISGDFTFKNRTDWTRTVQLIMGVKPDIKYGEHKWGAFA